MSMMVICFVPFFRPWNSPSKALPRPIMPLVCRQIVRGDQPRDAPVIYRQIRPLPPLEPWRLSSGTLWVVGKSNIDVKGVCYHRRPTGVVR